MNARQKCKKLKQKLEFYENKQPKYEIKSEPYDVVPLGASIELDTEVTKCLRNDETWIKNYIAGRLALQLGNAMRPYTRLTTTIDEFTGKATCKGIIKVVVSQEV